MLFASFLQPFIVNDIYDLSTVNNGQIMLLYTAALSTKHAHAYMWILYVSATLVPIAVNVIITLV